MSTTTCRSCRKPITWVKTEKGKNIPLDSRPDPNGNLVVRGGVAHFVKPGQRVEMGERLFVSHFVTCPAAKEHRRAR